MNSLIARLFKLITETEIIVFLTLGHRRQSCDDNELLMIFRLERCIMFHMEAFISECKNHLVKKCYTLFDLLGIIPTKEKRLSLQHRCDYNVFLFYSHVALLTFVSKMRLD